LKLIELHKGQKAIIDSVDLPDSTKRRLSNMGVSRGVILRVCSKSFGNSIMIKLDCSYCMAISKEEAQHIEVTPLGKGGGKFCQRKRGGFLFSCCNTKEQDNS
jgi:Fe2+ transport system protein FeoA